MYKILNVLMDGIWFPVPDFASSRATKMRCENLPTFVCIDTRFIGGRTEEEWINEYKTENRCNDCDLKFFPVIPYEDKR
jgi:hypothetical protein